MVSIDEIKLKLHELKEAIIKQDEKSEVKVKGLKVELKFYQEPYYNRSLKNYWCVWDLDQHENKEMYLKTINYLLADDKEIESRLSESLYTHKLNKRNSK